MIFSIVIPTYKRLKSLKTLLESLAKSRSPKFEVVVVEQGENHGKVIVERGKKMGLDLKYFFLKDRSTAKAMNVGVAKAKGEYILFLDDDVTVTPKFAACHLEN